MDVDDMDIICSMKHYKMVHVLVLKYDASLR
jgi:hypothetical protein